MTVAPVLVTGGSGFLGSQVLAQVRLSRPVRALQHRTPVARGDGDVEVWQGDLSEVDSLEGLCDGVAAVIHAASYIGDDPARCEQVNGLGSENLVREARRAGVGRIVYLSNAAVYGWAIHRGSGEDDVRVMPATAISRSRARAERAVLGAGGIVLRPLFVYGDGDARFVPAIIKALKRIPFLVGGGRARLSVISCEALAQVALAVADVRSDELPSGAYHVTDGHPVRFVEIAAALGREFGVRRPRLSLPYPVGRLLLKGVRRALMPGVTSSPSDDHRLFLVGRDHWYDDSRLRSLVPFPEQRSLPDVIGTYAAWYRRFLEPETPA